MEKISEALRNLETTVLTANERIELSTMLADDVQIRLRKANQRDAHMWAQVKSKDDWEQFRDERIKALLESLGNFPPRPKKLDVQVTRTIKGEGFLIENLVFESRPGILVTANLYLPDPLREKMPGILLCHSHHNPKTQGELQDMGMTWARLGAMVLVMDQVGHGERRQQPFGGRQDYYSRYFLGMQLYLVGESLVGWMVHDLMCGVDLLLNRPGIDPEKIILIGSVAGGGDLAAIAAALDTRIKCVVPFNFGGPQPETPYPLGDDAERAFNYAGSGEWESTRCLRLSARDGFLPWVIVGSVAPRYLIYAHEFSWDWEHDPVWKRLKKVFAYYNALDHLDFAHGAGVLSGRPPEATHCNNVGPPHRKMIYPVLKRWFGMPIPESEYQNRLPPEELSCLTPQVEMKLKPKPVHEVAAEIGKVKMATKRKELEQLSPTAKRGKLRRDWTRLLGEVEPTNDPASERRDRTELGDFAVERIVLKVEQNILVPMLLLLPMRPEESGERLPVVLAIAQEGKERFLRDYTQEVAELLRNGVAVCLPDLRGVGETRIDDERGRNSKETAISASELMLGQTLLGARLRDLRAVLRYLRERSDVDSKRIALWGDSFAPVNPEQFSDPPQFDPRAPEESKKYSMPHQSEPLGALLALLGALFEDDIQAVVARRGLVGFASILASHFCYVPHSVIVPGALTVGDLCDVAAALAPRPIRLEGMVDGRNRLISEHELDRWFKEVRDSYTSHPDRLQISSSITDSLAAWLVKILKEH